MKTFKKGKSAVRGRTFAASLLLGSALGSMAGHAYSQQPAAPAGAPQLAVAKPAQPQPESLQTPPVQVFHTSPAVRQATLDAVSVVPGGVDAVAQGAPRKLEPATGGTTPVTSTTVQEGPAPWLLDSDSRPWPLSYMQLNPLNTLMFTLPTEREARIMLPGQAADMVDRARFTVSRYITDNIGSASQIRGRQLETFSRWAENSTRQKASLSQDKWMVYQFNSELYVTLREFKAKVEGQTAPALARMTTDINVAVAQLTPVMEAMGSYEQKLQWYNVLVQLKEGIGLYQTRVAEADRQILAAVEDFEQANPLMPRPEGNPPAQRSARAPGLTEPTLADGTAAAAPIQRSQAQAPVAAEKPTGLGGSVVLLGVAGLILFFFLRLRKRVSNKGSTKKDPAT